MKSLNRALAISLIALALVTESALGSDTIVSETAKMTAQQKIAQLASLYAKNRNKTIAYEESARLLHLESKLSKYNKTKARLQQLAEQIDYDMDTLTGGQLLHDYAVGSKQGLLIKTIEVAIGIATNKVLNKYSYFNPYYYILQYRINNLQALRLDAEDPKKAKDPAFILKVQKAIENLL